MSIFLPFSSISSFVDDPIGVSTFLICSIPNLFNKSLMYLPWLMKMSSFFCLICNLIKKSNSSHHAHFELILHAFCKFLTKKYISNTEYNIINIYLYNQYVFTFSFCEEGGVNFTNIKLFSIKKIH